MFTRLFRPLPGETCEAAPRTHSPHRRSRRQTPLGPHHDTHEPGHRALFSSTRSGARGCPAGPLSDPFLGVLPALPLAAPGVAATAATPRAGEYGRQCEPWAPVAGGRARGRLLLGAMLALSVPVWAAPSSTLFPYCWGGVGNDAVYHVRGLMTRQLVFHASPRPSHAVVFRPCSPASRQTLKCIPAARTSSRSASSSSRRSASGSWQ